MTGNSTCLYKTSEILLIYYKEFYPKGVIKHEAYMRHATRHIQGRHEATLITILEWSIRTLQYMPIKARKLPSEQSQNGHN